MQIGVVPSPQQSRHAAVWRCRSAFSTRQPWSAGHGALRLDCADTNDYQRQSRNTHNTRREASHGLCLSQHLAAVNLGCRMTVDRALFGDLSLHILQFCLPARACTFGQVRSQLLAIFIAAYVKRSQRCTAWSNNLLGTMGGRSGRERRTRTLPAPSYEAHTCAGRCSTRACAWSTAPSPASARARRNIVMLRQLLVRARGREAGGEEDTGGEEDKRGQRDWVCCGARRACSASLVRNCSTVCACS